MGWQCGWNGGNKLLRKKKNYKRIQRAKPGEKLGSYRLINIVSKWILRWGNWTKQRQNRLEMKTEESQSLIRAVGHRKERKKEGERKSASEWTPSFYWFYVVVFCTILLTFSNNQLLHILCTISTNLQ